MSFLLDHDLHIHSQLSSCSRDPEQTPARLLQYAQENHLSTICITDHYWDAVTDGASGWYRPQDFAHISAAKPLPQAEGVRFLFGCETEMDRHMQIGMPRERFDDFDFVIIPTTHFHMTSFTIPAEYTTPEQRAVFWLKKLNALLDMDLPFRKIGIAHLTCSLIFQESHELFLQTIDALPTAELEQVFRRAAEVGVGIELNAACLVFPPEEADTLLRPYRIAKEAGCKFYCGSDAHHPAELYPASHYASAIAALGLTADDQFRI